MRMSQLFIQTLRDTPTEAGMPGYQFLLRAGLVRPLAAGSYGFLPVGTQARRKIETLVRRTLAEIGGQEVSLPAVQPIELLIGADNAGQAQAQAGPTMTGAGIRFRDRSQREVVLGTSHEGALLTLARNVVQSYRQLPVLLYHVWQSFRDEARTGGGLFGAREALLVDGYSLHESHANLEDFYPRAQNAFAGVFEQCHVSMLSAIAGQEMGVATTHKLIWPTPMGEETVIVCDGCGYTADQSIARAGKTPPPAEAMLPMEDVETPNCKTIADLAEFLDIPESRTAKALFLVAYIEGEGDRFVFAVIRGDTDLNEAKLKHVLNAQTVGPATEAEIRNMGAEPGYGSPIGLEGVSVVVDDLIPQSPNLVAGANRPGYHTRNVNYGRDYQAAIAADITLARAGDRCPECGALLREEKGIQIASTVKAGREYSQAADATYLDPAGQAQPIVMGRYRLYVDRLLAAVAETHHDERGIVWPAAVAPFGVYLMTLGKRSEAVDAAAERLYTELTAAGVDVLYDDRDERAGVKFNDADLLGMPVRVVVGERGLKNGTLELKGRREEEAQSVPIEDVAQRVLMVISPQTGD
jgi:prolyl-tRNA synthetase